MKVISARTKKRKRNLGELIYHHTLALGSPLGVNFCPPRESVLTAYRTTSSAAGIEKLSRHREQHAPQSQTNDHTRGDTASTGNSQSQSEAPSQGLAVPTS